MCELVQLVEDQRHEERAERGEDDPDDHERTKGRQPARNAPAADLHPGEAADQRPSHDGQYGRDEDIDDDRREVPDQVQRNDRDGRTGEESEKGLGCRRHVRSGISRRCAPCAAVQSASANPRRDRRSPRAAHCPSAPAHRRASRT